MNAVGSAASILHIFHQCFSHFQKARGFEGQLKIYLLQLQMHLDRCATVSRIIHNTNGTDNFLAIITPDGPRNTSEDEEPTIEEFLSTIQNILRKAQQEAAKLETDFVKSRSSQLEADVTTLDLKTVRVRITGFLDKQKTQAAKTIEGMKWAFYKKAQCDKFIIDISTLIQHLERKVNREGLTLGETRIIYIVRDHSSIMYEAEHDDV